MDIRIVDRSRTVTIIPASWPPGRNADVRAILTDLLRQVPRSSVVAGQIEFECDNEFCALVKDTGDLSALPEHQTRIKDGIVAVASFDGIPLVVRA